MSTQRPDTFAERCTTYLSVCSGIEAASVAWHPLGWRPFAFSDIEPFPCAVLAHHYPSTPNLGDMTKFKDWPDATIDVLVGGTPCQSFSIAGLRKGLADPRGNLMLTYGAIAAKYRPRWLVWENVPGVLSSNGGGDFGAFLGMLGELGYGFAYRVLDAQFYGVAQRRRRVFVVGCLGNWRRAAAVLFERDCLSGNPAPRRQAREDAASAVADCLTKCRAGSPDEARGTANLIARAVSLRGREGGGTAELGDDVQNCLRASSGGGDKPHVLIPVGVTIHGTDPTVQKVASYDDVAQCLRARTPGNIDNSSTTVVQYPLAYSIRPMNSGKDYKARETDVAQPIMAGGPTGGNQGGDYVVMAHGQGGAEISVDGGAPTLTCNHEAPIVAGPLLPVAFSCKDHGADAGDVAPTLRAMGHGASHANAGGQVAVAYVPEISTTLVGRSSRGGGQINSPGYQADQQIIAFHPAQDPISSVELLGMGVRRLTPRECERLQGFPDDYTLIPVRGKPAADGPRYKALGNSMAVPVMRWIGQRIAAVDEIA